MNTAARLDLREQPNSGCLSCDRMTRREFLENGVCKQTVSVLDQLPVRCVGGWSYDKIYRLVKYFGIFANGMKNAWKGLNYVEICSGPGRCITRDQRTEMDGTALSIITHPVFPNLRKAFFIDADGGLWKPSTLVSPPQGRHRAPRHSSVITTTRTVSGPCLPNYRRIA